MTYTHADIRRMKCDNCGEQPWFTDPFRRIEVDHIIPLSHPSLTGTDTEDNWQPLCGRCNRHKSVMTNAEARTATTLRDSTGREVSWPRGFDHATGTWVDGSAVDWVYGQLFSYPVRVAVPNAQWTEAV